jgi:histidyl-tRNA synthetase
MENDDKPRRAQAVRGMQDLIGEEADRFHHVVDRFRDVARRFGFRPVQVPVVEYTQVFARSLGETTDVVAKEMYCFEDRSGESLTLRPEFTAGICRAYVSEGWQRFGTLKLVTHGPLFRYERPQKGRYRQFHQVDAEVIGSASPLADVELIAFADMLLKELGIVAGVTLQLNTLGDAESRAAWRDALVAHFARHRDALSEDSQRRLETNPLRILDSKDKGDRDLVADAPGIGAFLTSEAGRFFDAVRRGLDASGVAFVDTPTLVRGFDYYRHTAFEFVTDRLGAQGTLIGGGRYDGLIEAMGGPSTPAVGWAGGIERLMAIASEPQEMAPQVAVIAETDAAEPEALRVADALRRHGISAIAPYQGNPRKRAEAAGKAGAETLLYVRDPHHAADRLKLVDRRKDENAASRMQQILSALPEEYQRLVMAGELAP